MIFFFSDDLTVDISFYVVGTLLTSSAILGLPLRRVRAWEESRAQRLKIIKIEEVEMQETDEKVERYESTI